MAWNALVVIITAVVTLLGLREGVRWTLIRELDALLREDLREIELAMQRYSGAQARMFQEQLDRKAQGHAGSHWFAQLIDPQGQVVFETSHAPGAATLSAARAGTPCTISPWRVLAQPRRRDRPEAVSVRVGVSLDMIHADVARLDRLVTGAASLVLLFAPLCGYWLALRATRPLGKMIATMAELRPSELHDRLELRGTGDELDQLSVTFNRLLDRIGDYLQERRDFVANAAHELRTPLAAIRSSVEVALAAGRRPEEYQKLLTEIIEESSSLEVLVNQLLLLSEAEAERLKGHHDRVRLDEIMEKSLDMFGGLAEFRDIQLSSSSLPAIEVRGNRQHLRQLIYNLLDNALKFTTAGGRVQVTLAAVDDSAELVVEDTGSGIPAEDLPHVFDRFFRGDRTRSSGPETRGTGLGLSICQSVVRAHEGTITAESKPGQGTRFIVRLPLANEEHRGKWQELTRN